MEKENKYLNYVLQIRNELQQNLISYNYTPINYIELRAQLDLLNSIYSYFSSEEFKENID